MAADDLHRVYRSGQSRSFRALSQIRVRPRIRQQAVMVMLRQRRNAHQSRVRPAPGNINFRFSNAIFDLQCANDVSEDISVGHTIKSLQRAAPTY